MAGISTQVTASADNRLRWADLDKQNERLVDATHPLLAELRRDCPAPAKAEPVS
jgi:hypothetical protein